MENFLQQSHHRNQLYGFVSETCIQEYSKTIPIDLRFVLVNLEFISMIKRGYKINTNTMNFVDANSWFGSIRRMLGHENRRNTLDFVVRIVSLTIDMIDKYEKSSYLKIIINTLNSARVGISELASTYREDPEIVSNLKVCLQNIDIQLDKYKNLIKGFDSHQISSQLPPMSSGCGGTDVEIGCPGIRSVVASNSNPIDIVPRNHRTQSNSNSSSTSNTPNMRKMGQHEFLSDQETNDG